MFPYTLYCAHREMFEFIIQGHSAHSWLSKKHPEIPNSGQQETVTRVR